MDKSITVLLSGDPLDEHETLSLSEICRACDVQTEYIIDMVAEGVIEPLGQEPAEWHFPGVCLRRVRISMRLQRDLNVNLAGAALALDLLEEIDRLRARD